MSEFSFRWHEHTAVRTTYPSLAARHAALGRVWQQAKDSSLVSIKGAMDEMVLFGEL